MSVTLGIVLAFVALFLGVAGGYVVNSQVVKKRASNAQVKANKLIEDAENQAKALKKEAMLEAKEEAIKLKTETENELKERRAEVARMENRAIQKEESLDRKEEALDKKQAAIDQLKADHENKIKELEKREESITERLAEVDKELERVSGLSKEEAKTQLIATITDEANKEAGVIVREIEAKAKEEGEQKARNIITLAIQKCATDQTSEVTVSSVELPNDEMKGRIIGREGRNIRAIESATGVELIVDDTPGTITLSCFDPIRREVARQTLEKLITDGRIHPARIEDIVDKVKKDIEKTIKESGENATFEAGIYNLHPELIKLLGRLQYRTSYGQNCLKHSLETSFIAGLLAGELGADVALAKRGGLLHDIGKALDFEMEGTHVDLGVEVAKKYKESPEVIHCIEAHHGAVEYQSIEAILVQVADAISSSRPGARRESLETYVKRLEKLESIANSFKGVASSYAIQAGREVRIAVKPEEVSDTGIVVLAKDIARKIESELEYPGQIKVNIIRETRATDIAS
ncbi:MAG: ribonuclease Y [Clostridia bacterium]|nr:ribonuclease Y [Clostridia bacterium]